MSVESVDQQGATIEPGSTLLRQRPFAYVVVDEHAEKLCHYCFFAPDDSSLLKCARCKVTRYCGRQCQQSDWKENQHAGECAAIVRFRARSNDDDSTTPTSDLRLLVRVLLLLRKSRVEEDSGRTFESLRHREADSGSLGEVIGAMLGNVVDPADFALVYSRVYHNTLAMLNRTLQEVGICVGFGFQQFATGCVASAQHLLDDVERYQRPRMKLVAMRSADSASELRICRQALLAPSVLRRRFLREEYFDDDQCQCRWCDAAERATIDARLLSIKCPACGDGVVALCDDDWRVLEGCDSCQWSGELERELQQELSAFLKTDGELLALDEISFKLRVVKRGDDSSSTAVFDPEFWRRLQLLSPLNAYFVQTCRLAVGFFLGLPDYRSALDFQLQMAPAVEFYYPDSFTLLEFYNTAGELSMAADRAHDESAALFEKSRELCQRLLGRESDLHRYLVDAIARCDKSEPMPLDAAAAESTMPQVDVDATMS